MINRSLEEDLSAGGVDIDARDSIGNTALSWAVQREDIVAVNLLLKHTANPNIANKRGASPLLYAAKATNPACLNLLLRAGVDAFHRDNHGHNALHYATTGNGSSEVIKALISANVDIEGKSLYGITPLIEACSFREKKVDIMKTLLDCGAKINSTDWEGDPALFNPIFYGIDDATQLLLSCRADYTLANHNGQTVLHYAAMYGTLKTLEILQNASLIKLNPNAVDSKGKTALQAAEEREGKEEGFVEIFRAFHFSICNRNDQQNHHPNDPYSSPSETEASEVTPRVVGAWPSDDEESDPEEFVDAPEV
ncbi:MAG: hypothetical protein Q9187_001127 [Circinaria calcarea]